MVVGGDIGMESHLVIPLLCFAFIDDINVIYPSKHAAIKDNLSPRQDLARRSQCTSRLP